MTAIFSSGLSHKFESWQKKVKILQTQRNFSVDIRAEMQPEDKPDVSEVAKFDSGTLKHVSTEEKDVKPTQEGELVDYTLLYKNHAGLGIQ